MTHLPTDTVTRTSSMNAIEIAPGLHYLQLPADCGVVHPRLPGESGDSLPSRQDARAFIIGAAASLVRTLRH